MKANQMKDKLGIIFSSLCFCHCVITPILILVLGTNLFVGVLASEWVHKLLILPVVLMALSTIPKRWLITRNTWLLVSASLGIVALFAAQLYHGLPEVVLTLIGSLSLIAAHMLSLRLNDDMKATSQIST